MAEPSKEALEAAALYWGPPDQRPSVTLTVGYNDHLTKLAGVLDAYAAARVAEALSDDEATIEAMGEAILAMNEYRGPQAEYYKKLGRASLAALRRHILETL